jgi:hypothetical protein
MYFVFLMNQALNMQHQFIFSGVGADFLTDKIKLKKKKIQPCGHPQRRRGVATRPPLSCLGCVATHLSLFFLLFSFFFK